MKINTSPRARNRLASAFASGAAWSPVRPTSAGYYWLRFHEEAADMVWVEPGLRVVHFYDENGPQDLATESYDDALWIGPLSVPE